MARDGGLVRRASNRLLEVVEEVSGRQFVEADHLRLVEHDASDARRMRRALDFIGFSLFNLSSLTGTVTGELRPQARRQMAQESLVAWVSDPMAGQAVDLYISFVFGRGVPNPQAHDAEVQDVLDATWSDPANREVLTSFDKLIEKGVDLNLFANVYFLIFDEGDDGRVRLGWQRFDSIDGVRRHPDQPWRILYFRGREQKTQYDYATGSERPIPGADGQPQTIYLERFGAFDDSDAARAAADANVQRPPDAMRRPGKVLHLAVNKTSEMAFGIPRSRRLIRWYTAYNEILEAHVDRMKAMASVYMKMTARGASQRDLDRLAMMATQQGRSSPLGASRDLDTFDVFGDGYGKPRTPGVLAQNESLSYEPFKIDSGASDVNASAPHLRAQFAAGSGFVNPGYFGAETGALAGAQAVELPTLKFVERDQELWVEGVFRPFAKRAIDRAIEAGFLDEWRDPTTEEAEQIVAAEQAGEEPPYEISGGRIRRDLGFTISLPSPLKRAMLDLISGAVQTATAVDPNATNPELSRWLFGFILREAFDVDDPQRVVDQVLPKHVAQQLADQNAAAANPVAAAAGTPDEGAAGADGQRHGAGNPYGAPITSPAPEQRGPAARLTEAPEGRRRRELRARRRVLDAFDEDVRAVAERELAALGNVTVNGNGNGGEH